jgi:CYTH domain-containing protein
MKHILMATALEELANGDTVIEDELVFYARLESLGALKNALAVESHEQWEIKCYGNVKSIEPMGCIRVRKTTIGEQVEYVQTVKTKRPDGAKNETGFAVTESVFDQFKLLATSGMIKKRYTIDIPGRQEKWEVDVFQLKDGRSANWVKIDLEWKQAPDRTIPELPQGFEDVILPSDRSEETREFINTLYKEVFLTIP